MKSIYMAILAIYELALISIKSDKKDETVRFIILIIPIVMSVIGALA